jgi:putative RNA 2'-phosphotransferase
MLSGLKRQVPDMDREWLIRVVELNDKGRFEFSSAGDRIRARQGHSLAIYADCQHMTPREYLFHGTVDRFNSRRPDLRSS